MNKEKAIKRLENIKETYETFAHELDDIHLDIDAISMAIEALEQEPCGDAISRQAVFEGKVIHQSCDGIEIINGYAVPVEYIENLPPVTPHQKTGYCKNCKYFEYDSVAKVDGIPLIVAHEICKKWGDGCKTKEDGYCFLFEPQESEDKE